MYTEFNGVMHFRVRLWAVTLKGQVELRGGVWTGANWQRICSSSLILFSSKKQHDVWSPGLLYSIIKRRMKTNQRKPVVEPVEE